MIKFDNIDFRYRGNKQLSLEGISASIGEGVYLLAGENGAGKTTLMHIIAGLAHATSGTCSVNGIDAATSNPDEMGDVFLLEENMYFPGKTIRKFAKLHSRFYPKFSEEQLNHNLAAFGLTGDEPIKSLSLGNKKKTQLAYVLALGVSVLLLDEPTNALDIESRDILGKLIATSVKPGQTLLISTHTVTEFDSLFDGAVILKKSNLIYAGTADDVASKLTFELSCDADPDALYSELQGARYLNIYPAETGDESRINWRSLYCALHADNSSKLREHLNHSSSNYHA